MGSAVGFTIREDLEIFPVKAMRGYGTHHQPPGTWSDDSSLTFCLVESLIGGYSAEDLSRRLVRWYEEGYWTAHGEAFDVGNTTKAAIEEMKAGNPSTKMMGGQSQHDNGNGSLMRILPVIFYPQALSLEERYALVAEVSSLTHGHFRSVFSCFIYTEIARLLLEGASPLEAYQAAVKQIAAMPQLQAEAAAEQQLFERVLDGQLQQRERFQIHSSGYVIHTLEASLWSWLNAQSFEEVVLTAVNLGADTDTVGAIAGGLAGLTYGYDEIPIDWLKQLVRKADILDLADRLVASQRNDDQQTDKEVA